VSTADGLHRGHQAVGIIRFEAALRELLFSSESAMICGMSCRGKRFLKIGVLLAAITLLLAAGLFFFPQSVLCVDSGPVKADVIIVLGGGAHERPEYAAQLFLAHAAPRIIVSGLGDDEINRQILVRAGVPAGAIWVEKRSKTTRENARFSASFLKAAGVHSAIIVTSWYHSRRALKTFEHYVPGIKFYSRPSHYNYKRAQWSRDFTRRVYFEYIKLPGYWVRYGVWPF
jgi:uncharacterized SAM-binding protein YcdF (DUF218 family)